MFEPVFFRRRLAAPPGRDGRQLQVLAEQAPAQALSVSIGVAVAVPFSDWQPQWLLDAANRAVHEAKHSGGDTWRHGPFRVTAPLGAVS